MKRFTVAVLLVLGCIVDCAYGDGHMPEDSDKHYWLREGQLALRRANLMRNNHGVAKNVILFIGDGMGVSTVTAARIYKGQLDGHSGEETQLNFEKFPYVALSKTYNTDRQTPDSAGTATAFLAGVKANYGTLGVDARVKQSDCSMMNDTDVNVETIADWSRRAGKSTGIVTTTRITHATIGALYAHTPDRNWEKDSDMRDLNETCVTDIAYQLAMNRSHFQVLFGGGRRNFFNRDDGLNLTDEWLAIQRAVGRNAKYVENLEQLRNVSLNETDSILGLFSESHMEYELLRDKSQEPSISEMTAKAIEVLRKNDKGFFLLVEGGRIDHGHHATMAKKALTDTIAFDEAVKVAKDMTGEDTLLVVTADHSHVFNIAGYPKRGNNILGLVDPQKATADGMPYATLVYANGEPPGGRINFTNVDTTADDHKQARLVPIDGTETETHGGEDVAIYATGPMAHLFHGVQEQSYIAHAMGYAACIGPNQDHCHEDNVTDPPPCTSSAVSPDGKTQNLGCFLVLLAGVMRAVGLFW